MAQPPPGVVVSHFFASIVLAGCSVFVNGDVCANCIVCSSAVRTVCDGLVIFLFAIMTCSCVMNCRDWFIVFASPFLTSIVCSLRSSRSLSVIVSSSSSFASCLVSPSLLSLWSSCVFSRADCCVVVAMSFFAWFANVLSCDVVFHISVLFFRPYSFRSSFSCSMRSFCHGCPGLRNARLILRGSPIYLPLTIYVLPPFFAPALRLTPITRPLFFLNLLLVRCPLTGCPRMWRMPL